MKIFLTLLLIGFGVNVYSQANSTVGFIKPNKFPPIYVIDGVPLNDNYRLSFKESEISKKHEAAGSFRDTLFITLKEHRQLQTLLRKKRLSLQQLAYQNIADLKKSSAVIFFKNDSLLLDTAGIKISAWSVFKTTVLRAVKTSYYQNLPDATFLYIYTTPQPMYIR